MKLVIDIPDKMYETVQNDTYCGTLYEELKNGIPLSELGDCVSRQAVLEIIRKCHCEEWVKADIGAPIEALQSVNPAEKQEPCIDAISREAVIDIIEDVCPIYGNDYRYILRDKVNELPPVTAEKVGQWINHKCSFCGYGVMPWNDTPYCPNCGEKKQERKE